MVMMEPHTRRIAGSGSPRHLRSSSGIAAAACSETVFWSHTIVFRKRPDTWRISLGIFPWYLGLLPLTKISIKQSWNFGHFLCFSSCCQISHINQLAQRAERENANNCALICLIKAKKYG